MRRVALLLALSIAGSSCAPSPPPLHVPGPTTSHPLAHAPAPGASPARAPGLFVRDAGSRVVAFRVLFQAGSADDPPGKEGLTRLTANVMTKGGTKVHAFAVLADKLYPLAASIEAHVERDQTVFTAEVAADSLEAFYPLLKEVILEPLLDAEGFERLRARAKSELVDELRGSSDEELGKEALAAAMYEGHPYGHPPVGTESGLMAVTVDDVRAQRDRAFCADRVVVGVAGAVPEGFEDRVTHDFAALPPCSAPRAELPAPKAIAAPHLLLVDKATADSTAISIGAPADFTRASPDFPALALFFDYVGLHRQSAGRLFHELRERRGLNYGDYAYPEYFAQEGGTRFASPNLARRQQMVSMWLRPVRPRNEAFALKGALHVFGEALQGGISQPELDRFRTFDTRYTSLAELTESRRLGHALDDLTYGAKAPYLASLRDAWRGLDAASLKAAVDRHLTGTGRSFFIAIVTHDAEALAKELTMDQATPPTYDSAKPREVMEEDKIIARTSPGITRENVRIVKYTDLFK